MPDYFESNRQTMEELFFLKEDQKLIEKLKAMKQRKEHKEALARVSGLDNDAVLEKLVTLGIQPETMACLSLTPLIEIAWADGKVDDKEWDAVMKAAEKEGITRDSIEFDLLSHWITRKPDASLLEAWRHFIQALCEKLSADERAELQEKIMGHAKAIAKVSGGFLGLGAVSATEQQVIEKLESAFGPRP